ncbi:diiron oxygenase [Alloalcanivorax mobilis]|uniref:diiron oxygenase n=1 Tax=Alloalcanivorax mobilis TaxID=2019569 RepID=UPI000B5B2DE7|nr:ferritin-like domain-containing protein [Alloalcanivorax mobilis]ASK33802.1 ferritin [Alcanivorax sp. N3-2A]|tara:strand:- start:39542 stop:40654 length:1113 start_codon:yes stop_codon:yes gene_type:complete
MRIKHLQQPPQEIRYYQSWDGPGHDDLEQRLTPRHVEDVVEIFQTPLTGHYNWDYSSADGRIRKLYRLGKELNWNADLDVDWSQQFPKSEVPLDQAFNPFNGWEPFESMSDQDKLRFGWHNLAWMLAQFVHGEQGALLVASQLASCAPSYDAKLYAASQTFDEARHVEVFTRYLQDKIGIFYPVNVHLKALLDKILSDPRWDLKFIGMQIIIEGLALAAFNTLKMTCHDPLLKQIITLVIRDEARHVTFGVNYLEDFVQTLSDAEREERAQFAFEACVVMRERLISMEVFEAFGWDADAAREKALESHIMAQFRNLLFTRIVPNLKRIGLLTEAVRPRFESLGILQFEHLGDDGQVDWAELSRPLYEQPV